MRGGGGGVQDSGISHGSRSHPLAAMVGGLQEDPRLLMVSGGRPLLTFDRQATVTHAQISPRQLVKCLLTGV